MNRDKTIIEHLIVHASKICGKMEKVALKEFLEDEDLKDIICFNFLQIGELAKLASIELQNKLKEIDWSGYAKFRDKIAHGYDSLKYEMIYNYCFSDIPILLKSCLFYIESLK